MAAPVGRACSCARPVLHSSVGGSAGRGRTGHGSYAATPVAPPPSGAFAYPRSDAVGRRFPAPARPSCGRRPHPARSCVTTWAWMPATPAPAQSGEVYPVPAAGAWEVEGAGFGHGHRPVAVGCAGRRARRRCDPTRSSAFYYPGTSFGNVGNPRTSACSSPRFQGATIVFGPYGQRAAHRDRHRQRLVRRSCRRPPATRSPSTAPGCTSNRLVGTVWEPIAMNGQVNIGGPIDIIRPVGHLGVLGRHVRRRAPVLGPAAARPHQPHRRAGDQHPRRSTRT